MKTFEIEVVRTYTTAIEVELTDSTTEEQVQQAVTGGFMREDMDVRSVYHKVWDVLAEEELQQCDTELIDYKVKLNK